MSPLLSWIEEVLVLQKNIYTFRWAVMDLYLKNKEQYSACILYDDLEENPELTISRFFNTLEIDSKHLPSAMDALKVYV